MSDVADLAETPEQLAAREARFQQRFDIARMVLERKYRWAKLTLRNLEPVARAEGTLAVDRFQRLYHGPTVDEWSDREFVGALWHEVNHLLRHHPDRLSHLPKKAKVDPKWVNLAADLEINDDLREQGLTLPEGVFYSDQFEQTEQGLAAEEHFQRFVDAIEEPPEPQEGDDEEGEGDDEEGDGEGDGQGPEGKGKGKSSGSNKPSNNPGPPDPQCGSGSGDEQQEWEEPEPSPEKQARQAKDQRKQDEEVVEAVEGNGGLPPGMSSDVYEAAKLRLDKPEHDWKQTLAVEIRNAMEQRADEAEEYTFRRRSRRAGISDEFILPGSFRPIPKLGVVVDLSGSMDQQKLTAAMREVHGVLERLAIPAFDVYAWNTQHIATIPVQSNADIAKVFERRGGGTDMQSGVNYAAAHGSEVIIVLTDNETHWSQQGPDGLPVIIGGINRGGSWGRELSDKMHNIPKWARVVDVEEVKEVQYDEEGDY